MLWRKKNPNFLFSALWEICSILIQTKLHTHSSFYLWKLLFMKRPNKTTTKISKRMGKISDGERKKIFRRQNNAKYDHKLKQKKKEPKFRLNLFILINYFPFIRVLQRTKLFAFLFFRLGCKAVRPQYFFIFIFFIVCNFSLFKKIFWGKKIIILQFFFCISCKFFKPSQFCQCIFFGVFFHTFSNRIHFLWRALLFFADFYFFFLIRYIFSSSRLL